MHSLALQPRRSHKEIMDRFYVISCRLKELHLKSPKDARNRQV